VLGRTDDAEIEVRAFEKNRTYTITRRKAGVRIDMVFTFDSVSDGIRVGIEFDLIPHVLPPSLLSPVEWESAERARRGALSARLVGFLHARDHPSLGYCPSSRCRWLGRGGP